MGVNQSLLEILVCPENKSKVSLAPTTLVNEINQRIASGAIKNRAGQPVKEKIESGLIRLDGKYLYPIRDDIPVMLIDEAIELSS